MRLRMWAKIVLPCCISAILTISICAADEKQWINNIKSPWIYHEVHQLAPENYGVRFIPARFQIVSEQWNRVVACPYLVYMPEKDRLVLGVSCDWPHRAFIMFSDDHGATWSEPQPVAPPSSETGHKMMLSLTYLGQGKLLCCGYASDDYGQTWQPSNVLTGPDDVKGGWNRWDPCLVDYDPQTGRATRLLDAGYTGVFGNCQVHLRFSQDLGRTWSDPISPLQWKGLNEIAFIRAANGDIIAACRTDLPEFYIKNRNAVELDHSEGLVVSISKDDGLTWSTPNRLYESGRHHPCMILLPDNHIVMTYVVRKGYPKTPDGFIQFGIEAVVSKDNGQTWDLDHRYILHQWPSYRKDKNAWYASSQSTATVLLPDGTILTAFGTGYRSKGGREGPRDVGLVRWQVYQ